MINEDLHQNVLKPDDQLLWYRIKRVLGRGSFGITYLAHDVNLDRLVAIKEYLPGHLAIRVADEMVRPISSDFEEDFKFGLGRFISEGRTLTRFEHPNLVRVFNAFEANNTAYMVMNYEIGESLHEFIKHQRGLTEKKIMQIIMPLLDGLQKMHAQGFIHRDIKPGNIFIRAADGSPVLLDFGSARQIRQASVHSLTNLVSPGYAPIEQYTSNSDKQGPWTDIYGLGATIYKVITGSAPMNAVDRGEAIMNDGRDNYIPLTQQVPAEYSNKFLEAIDHALVFKAGNRPQSITEWIMEFHIGENQTAANEGPTANDYISMIRVDEAPTKKIETTGVDEKTIRIATGNGVIVNDTPETNAVFKKPNAAWLTKKRALMVVTAAVVVVIIASIIMMADREGAQVAAPELQEPDSVTSGVVTAQTDTPANTDTATYHRQAEGDPPIEEKTADGEDNIQQQLALADSSIKELRLTTPQGNNAYEQYQQVLAIDPGNEQANAGIHTISDKYVALAYGAIKANNTDRARLYISKAGEIWPESDKIKPANEALQAKLQEISKQEEEKNITNEENIAPVEDQSLERATAESTKDEESGGVVSGVKKWFRGNAEKNKEADQTQVTGEEFVQSIGGAK